MRATRRILAVGALGALLAGSASGCAVWRRVTALFGGSSAPAPVPALASTPAAAAAFDSVRDRMRDLDRADLRDLRARLVSFLERWPDDGLAPLARVDLALVALAQKDTAGAALEIAATADLPPGSTHDLRDVARARMARIEGDPETALDILRPLVGKSVDPVVRAVFQEELALSALAGHRDYEAISYMDAWLREVSDQDRAGTRAKVASYVETLPKDVLVGALEAMRTQRADYGYGVDIQRILAQRLVSIATTSGDATLARMLLDPDAGAVVITGDAGVELGELATSRRGLDVVEGRTVGLLLPTESAALRDESADVLRGVMWALGLPRGVRGAASGAARGAPPGAGAPGDKPGAAPGDKSGTTAPCAPPEPAPPLEEPTAAEGLRLVTRDDAGSIDRTEVSLDELAGEGASIVIAGLDPTTATRALRWGDDHGVPVVAVVPPDDPSVILRPPSGRADDVSVIVRSPPGRADEPPGDGGFAFVLGEPRATVVDVLAKAAPSLTNAPVAPVVDESEVAAFPAQGGRVGPLTLLPPVSCDIPPARAGEPRFPLHQWDADKARGWLVSGSAGCARDVASELSAAHVRGVVATTLEAAALPAHATGLRVMSAAAGVVPEAALGDARDDELRRFTARLGVASWWTALGRDAATLARVAVRALPADSVSDHRSVMARRARARDLLAGAEARLWSTEANGWAGGRVMKRTVCAVSAGK